MIIREDEEIKNGSKEEKDTIPLLEVENEAKYLMNGEILITKCALSMQIKKDFFYTRCYVNDKVCSI